MRPIYEKQEDLMKEHEVFKTFETTHKAVCVKLPPLSVVDRLICTANNTLYAVAELKVRTNAHDKYPTYMLSATKHRAMLELSSALKVPALLFVQFTDVLMVAKIEDTYESGEGGRTDRGDALDVEECVYIPMEKFKKLRQG
jgi:hypothetical protein